MRPAAGSIRSHITRHQLQARRATEHSRNTWVSVSKGGCGCTAWHVGCWQHCWSNCCTPPGRQNLTLAAPTGRAACSSRHAKTRHCRGLCLLVLARCTLLARGLGSSSTPVCGVLAPPWVSFILLSRRPPAAWCSFSVPHCQGGCPVKACALGYAGQPMVSRQQQGWPPWRQGRRGPSQT
jgi:hypothetical protein